MKISVIVPFLNEEKYIEKCIKSLVNQNFPKKDYELIFIDNGSTDCSIEIVKKYKTVKLLFEKITNPYAARNKGIKNAKGEIIIFTDADCQASNDWIKNIYSYFKSHKNTRLILGRTAYKEDLSLGLKIIQDYENEKLRYVTNPKFKKYVYGLTNNLSIRKDTLNKFGLFLVNNDWNHDARLANYVANNFINQSIRYLDTAKTTHLEIESVNIWFGKMNFYGKDCVELSKSSDFKFLKINHNFDILYKMIKRNKYNLLKSIYSLYILGLSFVYFNTGRYFKNV